MLDNELTTAREIKSSAEPTQRSKSSAEIFALLMIYLIAGMMVMVIILLVYVYG